MASGLARIAAAVHEDAHPLFGWPRDFDPLLRSIGESRVVLLGEASHGTHEFYSIRQTITQRLIAEHDFDAVIAEADWPDAWRVNRFVRGHDDDPDAHAALAGFRRFPHWMWRNQEVLEFVDWLRRHNDHTPMKAGFYGMDLYSLHSSIHAVLGYLDKIDPAAAKRARFRYGWFEDFGEDPQSYGYAAGFDLDRSCEDRVVAQLVELQRRRPQYVERDGARAPIDFFEAEQNARVVRNAEAYYRQMFDRRVDTWNLRDTHMVETIDAIRGHLARRLGRPAKVVVWAHNSHLGDARATDVAQRDQINVGQLVRERWGEESYLVGFSTHTGFVTAADNWDEPADHKAVRPSLEGSYERIFHEAGIERFLLLLREPSRSRAMLLEPRLQRAIGVIYRPQTERMSHYFEASLPRQFDAMIHIDRTTAVRPLEASPAWMSAEVDETYPSGL